MVIQSLVQGLVALGAASAAGLYFHIGWLQNEQSRQQRYIMDYLGRLSEYAFPSWEGSDRVERESELYSGKVRMAYHLAHAEAVRVYFLERILKYFRSIKDDCLKDLSETNRRTLREFIEHTFRCKIRENRRKPRASDYLWIRKEDTTTYRDESNGIFEKFMGYLSWNIRTEFTESKEVIIERIREICYDAEIQVKELDKARQIHNDFTIQLKRYSNPFVIGPFLFVIGGIIGLLLIHQGTLEYWPWLYVSTIVPLVYMGIYLGVALLFIWNRARRVS